VLGDAPEYPRAQVTAEDGKYLFDNVLSGFDYRVKPESKVDYTNGVSTLDLVKIQRHILGLEDLDSPYKIIASDINNDEKLKSTDLLQLRKLILGVIAELPDNDSWRFVDRTYEFPDVEDPFGYPETHIMTDVDQSKFNQDFIAIKVGDVNGNATANIQHATSEVRSNDKLQLEQVIEAIDDQYAYIHFVSRSTEDIYGLQWTMDFNGVELIELVEGQIDMNAEHIYEIAKKGLTTMSWNAANGVAINDGDVLFSLKVKSAEVVTINSDQLRAEAYLGEQLKIVDIEMVEKEVVEIVENTLYQNEPNPFKESTMIAYELTEEGAVTFTITDVAGKIMKVINTEGVRGYNSITLESDDLGVSGVFYYTIRSGEFTDTKKMIVVR